MPQVLFYAITQAQYAALTGKNENALYFLTDAGKLYKGAVPFSHPVVTVTAFPTSGETGAIYLNTATKEAKVWNGSVWVSICGPVITDLSGAVDAEIPTAAAVKSYIEGRLTEVNSGVSGSISEVTYANKSITVSKGTGSPVTTALAGLFDGVSYDGSTGVLTFTANGGTSQTVNLPLEQFISAASYDHATRVLTLTLNNSTTVDVSLADLVDIYTGGNTSTAQVAVNSGAITTTVKVSAEAGNLVEAKSDGLYAGLQWQSLS